MFGFWVEIFELPLQLPGECDGWIMLAFVEQEFSDDGLIRLDRVRCHQHGVLFKSDVFDMSGRALDRRYLF